jgi:hypothetical protein
VIAGEEQSRLRVGEDHVPAGVAGRLHRREGARADLEDLLAADPLIGCFVAERRSDGRACVSAKTTCPRVCPGVSTAVRVREPTSKICWPLIHSSGAS